MARRNAEEEIDARLGIAHHGGAAREIAGVDLTSCATRIEFGNPLLDLRWRCGAEHTTARPKGGVARHRIKIRRLVERSKVVVSKQRPLASRAHQVNALKRIGAVAHDIAKANHRVKAHAPCVSNDRLECGKVGVDVADNRDAHASFTCCAAFTCA